MPSIIAILRKVVPKRQGDLSQCVIQNVLEGVMKPQKRWNWWHISQKRKGERLNDMQEMVRYMREMEQEIQAENTRGKVKESFAKIWGIATNECFRRNKRNQQIERMNCSEGEVTDFTVEITPIDNECRKKIKG
ncbi:uncharacterized protein MONOS_16611 [Monocercomonoides exilis]|uniref:uncharacterized protein n=1 Tax=Monocercomonoides exilis TaxID=2049356 RepID=UPI00355A747F|nr:hypothetical protein MONOS_16611 [Monocercomonoides exilis]|eukprot:MONOS_16611.1-p1 / transcript=MONOS_16611.1 / gene=MONOS_16611 / organism=Monocercomonoides_exilis_PA203 / gene_product=unspecified product / transcript_product=unspecified product / location=Mono_scaffold01923:1711-2112(-) / protein_length=134 / sequence_SO=supercontig / SO=protein_coding / is_pseudo=false